MKLNKIKANCLNAKRFNLIEGPDGVQWFTDNRSLWLCMGIQVDRRVLPTLFGLTDKQVEKCLFLEESRTGDEYAIGMDGDEPVLDYCGDVWEYDQRLLAFRGKAGMLFVPRAWADAVAVTDETQYTVRMLQNSDGKPEPMVAVYNGMICEAMLQPIADGFAGYILKRMKAMGEIPTWTMEEVRDHVEAEVKAG